MGRYYLVNLLGGKGLSKQFPCDGLVDQDGAGVIGRTHEEPVQQAECAFEALTDFGRYCVQGEAGQYLDGLPMRGWVCGSCHDVLRLSLPSDQQGSGGDN